MDLPQIIKKFVSYDELRPKILSPWIKDDKVYVTNGHILLSFPSSYVDGFTIEYGIGVDASECMSGGRFKNFALSLLINAIKSQEPSYTIEPSFEECECCFGEGEYETNEGCDHCHSRGTKTVICHECQGSGSTKTPNPRKGEKRYKSTQTKLHLPQGEITVNWEYLTIIQDTMAFFKGIWKVANRDSLAPIHFKQNEQNINIVLMPMRT